MFVVKEGSETSSESSQKKLNKITQGLLGKGGELISNVKDKKSKSKDKKRVPLVAKKLKTTKKGMDGPGAPGKIKPVVIEQPTGPSRGERSGVFSELGINDNGTPV
jgi:hypothetical protein